MFKFIINDLIKNTSFAINKVKIVEVAFDKLFVFIITINEHNNFFFFHYKHMMFFIYYVVNNQIKFNYFRIIKHINLNVNYHKDIINFIEFYKKKLNKIRFQQ